jgi:RHS repeat-associated protein
VRTWRFGRITRIGNLSKQSKGTNAETWTYGYDARNHLIWAEDRQTDGGSLITRLDYKYDALENRIEKDVTANSVTTVTHFAYDRQNVWADLSGTNVLQTRRLFLDNVDSVYARISAAGVAAWYISDRQGTIQDIENAAGTMVLDQYTWDAWGNVLSESAPANGDRMGFTGREREIESRLDFRRDRYYNPATGTWTTEDPIGFAAMDYSAYRYVFNGPTNAVDPNGLQTMWVDPGKGMTGRLPTPSRIWPNFRIPQITGRPQDDNYAPPYSGPSFRVVDPGTGLLYPLFSEFVDQDPRKKSDPVKVTWDQIGVVVDPQKYGGGKVTLPDGGSGLVLVALPGHYTAKKGFERLEYDEGMAIAYFGDKADKIAFLQTWWLEGKYWAAGDKDTNYTHKFDDKDFNYPTTVGDAYATVDLTKKRFMLDSAGASPDYLSGPVVGGYIKGGVIMFDHVSAADLIAKDMFKKLTDDSKKPLRVWATMHFQTYLLYAGKPVYEVDWDVASIYGAYVTDLKDPNGNSVIAEKTIESAYIVTNGRANGIKLETGQYQIVKTKYPDQKILEIPDGIK